MNDGEWVKIWKKAETSYFKILTPAFDWRLNKTRKTLRIAGNKTIFELKRPEWNTRLERYR
jgi:hypothetical protein